QRVDHPVDRRLPAAAAEEVVRVASDDVVRVTDQDQPTDVRAAREEGAVAEADDPVLAPEQVECVREDREREEDRHDPEREVGEEEREPGSEDSYHDAERHRPAGLLADEVTDDPAPPEALLEP